jgi:hypothetical protein
MFNIAIRSKFVWNAKSEIGPLQGARARRLSAYNFQYKISYIESIINCTPHLLKSQPEDGPAVLPKHVAEL